MTQWTTEQIQDRVLELVASVELQARRTRQALHVHAYAFAEDMAAVNVALATELAELMGRGRLIVERELHETAEQRSSAGWEVSRG